MKADVARQHMDPEQARLLTESMSSLPLWTDRLIAASRNEPAMGSRAASDLQIAHGRFVLPHAVRPLNVAFDHLGAWQLILHGGTLTNFAPITLLRGALEGAHLSRWLTDPDAAGLERVGRGLAAQLDDYAQRRRFEESAGGGNPGPGEGKKAAVRYAELAAARDEAGIPVVRFPSATDLAKLYGRRVAGGDPSWLYRLASAFAHGKEWAMLAMELGPEFDRPTEGVVRGQVVASDRVIVGTTRLTVLRFASAVIALERYVGEALDEATQLSPSTDELEGPRPRRRRARREPDRPFRLTHSSHRLGNVRLVRE